MGASLVEVLGCVLAEDGRGGAAWAVALGGPETGAPPVSGAGGAVPSDPGVVPGCVGG